MTGFQIVGITIAVVACATVIRAIARGRIGRGAGTIWLLLWAGAGVAIAWPELTVRVAARLGIARGADLVFYVAILAMIAGFFAVYIRIKRLESSITALVRRLALHDDREEP